MNQKMFGENEYKEVHKLAYEYKEGNKEAGLVLLEKFKVFKVRYIKLLLNGEYDITNRSIREFMKLYMEDKNERSFLNFYTITMAKKSKSVQNKLDIMVNKTARVIAFAYEKFDEEDITQSIDVTLLKMFKQYKDTKPSLHQYILKNFHYYLYRFFEKETKDPLTMGYVVNVITKESKTGEFKSSIVENILQDYTCEVEEEIILNKIDIYNQYLKLNLNVENDISVSSIYEDTFFDKNWVDGITCSSIFKKLSKMERKIIILWYVENYTDKEISEIFGVCRSTVNKKRAIAKNKIYEEAIKKRNVNKFI